MNEYNIVIFTYTNTGDYMETDKKRIETVKKESGMSNIHIDCNSEEGKMLIEVVEKEATMKDSTN